MGLNSDGVFVIQAGQGISQGIVKELGLNSEQIGKLDKNTWNSIFKEVANAKEADASLYAGGADINGKTNKNFVVQPDQTIKISLKGSWNKILDIVNGKLGTNFQIAEEESKVTDTPQQTTDSADKTIQDPDGKIAEKLTQIISDVIDKQHELSDKFNKQYGEGNWSQEAKDEYNNLIMDNLPTLNKLFGTPTRLGQKVNIVDKDSNIVYQLKAITL